VAVRADEVLWVDGRATGLRVGRAESVCSRARGVWPDDRWPVDHALLIPACRAVHTFGLRGALDVVFSDEAGRVIGLHAAVPPWRVRHHPAACATWEFRPGTSSRLGITTGTRLQARRVRGATLIEFLIAAMMVFLPMVFLTLELARLVVSRHALQHAVNDAAREAGFATRDGLGLRRSIAYGLLPLFAPVDPALALDATPGPTASPVAAPPGLAALGRSYAEVLRADLVDIRLESPDGTFRAVGFETIGWSPSGGVWRLRVRHCRELVFPLARQLIPELVRWTTASVFDQACLARDRLPLEVSALVLRPTRAWRAEMGDLPTLPPGDPGDTPTIPPIEPPVTDPVPGPSPGPAPDAPIIDLLH
jgi:uncharacterized membrane protein (UPF0127 family)